MSKLTRFKNTQLNQDSNIDKDNGIIKGISVITGNREALGHEMFIDDKTVDQVVEQGQESDKGVGLKARFDHPSACFSSMGTQLGRFKNFRREGDKAVADLHLLDANTEHKEFVLNLAEEDHEMFATSIVFKQGEPMTPQFEDHPDVDQEDAFFFPHARVEKLMACDVVDEGAANDGLFGRPDYLAEQAERWASENSEIIEPILFKVFEKYINTINMENKTEETSKFQKAVDKIKDTIASFNIKLDDSPEGDDGDAGEGEPKTDDIKEESREELNAKYEAVVKEVEDAKYSAKELKTTNENLTAENADIKVALKELAEEVEELGKIKLGTPVEPTGDSQDPAFVEPTKEEKETNQMDKIAQLRKEETDRLGYTDKVVETK